MSQTEANIEDEFEIGEVNFEVKEGDEVEEEEHVELGRDEQN
jgi:hypothetical protein